MQHELLQGTLYEMFRKGKARQQIIAYCKVSGERIDDVSAKFMHNMLSQHPETLEVRGHVDVCGSFEWSETDEGHNYWSDINDY